LIVVDASLMVAWLLDEPEHALGKDLDELLDRETLVVPSHWPIEVGNALLVNIRRQRVRPDQLEELMQECATLAILVEPSFQVGHIGALARLAIEHGLTLYDAAYIQIAIEKSIPLGTLDRPMRLAAQRLGVTCFPASAK
jgi:predicted nucleic acid-binding protein